MMAGYYSLLLLVITIQVFVNAAPSDVTKLEEIAKVDTLETEAKVSLEDNVEDPGATQGQRQKRWYEFGSFGFPPPINPVYPTFVKRDEAQSTGVYGLVEDPISQVYRRIQDVASFARQPNYPVLPPQFPIYLPVLYLPQACNCNPQTPQTDNKNETMPGINNRFPEMEDTRQNWGYVVDEKDFIDNGQDPSRPINFDRVPPNGTLKRPPPPVDHGTVQGDGNSNSVNSGAGTTRRPPRPPPAQDVPKTTSDELPTNCDAAVLSCCHRPEITLDCFTAQGCPSVNSYGNPCEPSTILRVIELFQRFYLQRTG